ncbi:MAG: hypothetical protein PHV68_06055, partial [Candidatus Gastranaerophilales bacterium]|nr:hypothetical protein [Candidatus Gastranaerophilales bacterium]
MKISTIIEAPKQQIQSGNIKRGQGLKEKYIINSTTNSVNGDVRFVDNVLISHKKSLDNIEQVQKALTEAPIEDVIKTPELQNLFYKNGKLMHPGEFLKPLLGFFETYAKKVELDQLAPYTAPLEEAKPLLVQKELKYAIASENPDGQMKNFMESLRSFEKGLVDNHVQINDSYLGIDPKKAPEFIQKYVQEKADLKQIKPVFANIEAKPMDEAFKTMETFLKTDGAKLLEKAQNITTD